MKASDITIWMADANGNRACSFWIGDVQIHVAKGTTGDNLYIAEELARAWNRDEEPEASPPVSSADGVFALCARLLAGPVTGDRFSVGPWTPAIDDGFSWAVLTKQGAPLLLAHDAFEAALYFARLEEGTTEHDGYEGPIRVPTDAQIADRRRWDQWHYEHRFRGPKGDPNFTPPCPYDTETEAA